MNKDNLLRNDVFLRSQIRKILTEQNTRILSETDWGTDDAMYGGGPRLNIFKTFVEPFTDVFKVATLAAKDITSAMIDVADYLITFNEEKKKNIQERYRQRRKKYSDKEVLSPNFLEQLTQDFRTVRPFLDYMSSVLTTDLNGVSLLDN